MSMETVARQTLYRQSHARGGDLRSLVNRELLGRIWRFAHRHHGRLRGFVAVSVVSALLAVATPVLAGKVVDANRAWRRPRRRRAVGDGHRVGGGRRDGGVAGDSLAVVDDR